MAHIMEAEQFYYLVVPTEKKKKSEIDRILFPV